MTKTEKIMSAVQTVIESAVVLCASGLAAVAYFDGLYGFFTACAAVAVFMQITVCVRTKGRELAVGGTSEPAEYAERNSRAMPACGERGVECCGDCVHCAKMEERGGRKK